MTATVLSLWRFPVKSMQGESVPELAITGAGAASDRAWGVFDLQAGRVVSAKDARLFPRLMQCRAGFLDPPQAGRAAPPVWIELPDGRCLHSDAPDADDVLSAFFGRPVALVRAPPGMQTYGQYTPRHRMAAPARPAAAAGALRDAFPVSLLTTSTLDALQRQQPGSLFDARRFRMNVILRTAPAGFVENDWLEQTLALGRNCRLRVTLPDPRCIMTTLPQDELPQDVAILKTIAAHNRLHVPGLGLRACAGVYAEVLQPGVLRVGDEAGLQGRLA